MTTQEIMDRLAAYLRDEVCSSVEFKVAAEYKRAAAEGYEFRLAPPAVYIASHPSTAAEHNKPNDDAPIVAPSIIVTVNGQQLLTRATGHVETPIKLLVQIWNPGQHTEAENGVREFRVGNEGWRDIAVFVDIIVKKLASAELPGGLELAGEDIAYSLPDAQENDLYPYYQAEVEFSVAHVRRLPNKFNI